MSTNQESLFQSLIERRFFRFVISYLVTGWALLQFVEFIVSNYQYSRVWIDGTLAFLLLLLPSVILLTYFHGRPGKDRVRTIEKFFVPFNLLFAVLAVIYLFKGKELGAMVDKVTITNEEGKQIERFVPKSSVSKRVVLFPLNVKGEDEDLKSLAFSIPIMQATDLEQDNRIFAINPSKLTYEYRSYGYELFDKLPSSIERKIAEDNYSDFYLKGDLSKSNDKYVLNAKVIATESGKVFYEQKYESSFPFDVIDQFSQDFRAQVYLKDAQTESFLDLPATDLYTSNTSAMDAFQKGVRDISINNNYKAAESHFQEAIESDKNFAVAHFYMYRALMNDSKQTEARPYIDKAMNYLDALSERQQLEIKYDYLDMEDVDKSISLLEMWTKLYPSDYRPVQVLLKVRQNRLEVDKAIEVGEQAIENGHTGKVLLEMAKIHSNKGETQKALEYYEQFEQEYPHKSKEIANLGYIYMRDGQLDKAQAFFEKLNTMNPNEIEPLYGLGNVAGNKGNFEDQINYYNKALSVAKQGIDSIQAYFNMENAYDNLGQINKSIEIMEKRLEVVERTYPPLTLAAMKTNFMALQKYVNIGKDEYALKIVDETLKTVDFSRVNLECVSKINYYILKEDAEGVENLMDKCEANIADLQGGIDLLIPAFLAYLKGEHEKSLELFRKYREATGVPNYSFSIFPARSLSALGKHDEGLSKLDESLKVSPNASIILHDRFKILLAKGDQAEAKKMYEKIMTIWKDADPEYIPKKELMESGKLL